MKHNDSMKQHDANCHVLGSRLAARLNDALDDVPHDVLERLKNARMQALSARKLVSTRTESSLVRMGRNAALQWGWNGRNSWHALVSWIPLLALIIGLLAISSIQDDFFTQEIANLDTELLTDELPPSAYADPGFALFVRLHEGD